MWSMQVNITRTYMCICTNISTYMHNAWSKQCDYVSIPWNVNENLLNVVPVILLTSYWEKILSKRSQLQET